MMHVSSTIKSLYFDGLKNQYAHDEIHILLKWIKDFGANEDFFHEAYQQLKCDVPIQYILQESYFYGLKFKVNQSVLIPRPETEELVDLIIKKHKTQIVNVLDICTGSGCVAISLAQNLPLAKIEALDISEEAIEIAKLNALNLNCCIDFYVANALEFEAESFSNYDVIVSNPPYIKVSEKNQMSKQVVNYEPSIALFVNDNESLIFYEKIADFALKKLNKHGTLYFEINQNLGIETSLLLENKGFNVQLLKDINQNDRMIIAQLRG